MVQRKTENEKISFLMKIGIFAKLGEEALRNVHFYFKTATFSRGAVVFSEGDSVDKVYLVKKGVFNVFNIDHIYIYIYID